MFRHKRCLMFYVWFTIYRLSHNSVDLSIRSKTHEWRIDSETLSNIFGILLQNFRRNFDITITGAVTFSYLKKNNNNKFGYLSTRLWKIIHLPIHKANQFYFLTKKWNSFALYITFILQVMCATSHNPWLFYLTFFYQPFQIQKFNKNFFYCLI